MSQEITRAAAVLRVSSAGQTDDDKDSIGNQRRLAETMAERHGWELVAEYDETAGKGFQSGRAKMNDRPYIQEMLAEAKEGVFDVVIFRDPSRLGRHDGEALSLGYDLSDENVLVAFSADDKIADIADKNDRLLFMIGQWAADVDWSNMKANVTRGRYDAAKDGRWVTGPSPAGYRRVRDGADKGFLEIDPIYRPVVMACFDLIASGEETPTTAGIRLGEMFPHLPRRPSGKPWSSASVIEWIRKKGYKGDGFEVQVAPTGDAAQELFTIAAPGIIDHAAWDLANRTLDRKVRDNRAKLRTDNQTRNEYALRGRLFHNGPEHAEPMKLVGAPLPKSDGTTQRVLRCNAATTRWQQRHPDEPVCGGFGFANNGQRLKVVNAGLVEALLIDELVERLQDADSLAGWVREADEQALAAERTEGDLATTAAALAQLDRRREGILTLLIDGDITRADKTLRLKALDVDREKIEARAARLNQKAADAKAFVVTLQMLEETTVGLLDVRPGDERDVYVAGVDESGADIEVVEGLGWLDALLLLRKAAADVVSGRTADLPAWATAWAATMAERLDVRGFVEDSEGKVPTVRFEATIDLDGPRSVEYSARNEKGRTPRRRREAPPSIPASG